MAINYNPKTVTEGLVLCLDAANPKSYPGTGNLWTDLSGNGNNGTLVNGVGYNSANNGSMVFDGANDYISIPDNNFLNLSSTMTLQCFFYINLYNIWAGLIGRSNNTKSVYGLNLSPTSQRLRFNYNNISPWTNNVESTSTLPLNQWIHGAVTYNGADCKIYLNGILNKTQNIGNIIFDTSPGFNIDIGYDNPGGNEFFNGNISQVSVYNRALSDIEIQQNFNAARGRYGI
jgi:hypothetical protein